MTRNSEDDGLARIGNAYFMVRSPNGATHAVNPKNKHTYCGHDMIKLWNTWRPTDLPDDKNQPTCKICQRHYDDPIRESLRQVAGALKEFIGEFLFMQVLTKNSDGGLGRFVDTYAKFVRSEYVKAKIRQELEKKEKAKP
jgi:hypothetical protein